MEALGITRDKKDINAYTCQGNKGHTGYVSKIKKILAV